MLRAAGMAAQPNAWGENATSSQVGCSCRCIFVDVGLNDGGTLMSWPQMALREMVLNNSRTRRRHAEMSACLSDAHRNSTCYFGFEANPSFTARLQTLERRLRAASVCVELSTSTAFGKTNGRATLHVDSVTENSIGSTLDPRKPVVGPILIRRLNLTANHTYSAERQVSSRDAAEFLQSLHGMRTHPSTGPQHAPFIAMKLDIEGFEYTLLPHLLKRAAHKGLQPADSVTIRRALCDIAVLAVEWHEKTGAPAYKGRTEILMKRLQQKGCHTLVLPWT